MLCDAHGNGVISIGKNHGKNPRPVNSPQVNSGRSNSATWNSQDSAASPIYSG